MKKLIILLLAILLLSVTGCTNITGVAPIISFDDFEFTIGEDTVQKLTSNGLQITNLYGQPVNQPIGKKSWVMMALLASKDDIRYAQVHLYNSTNKTVTTGSAQVNAIEIKMPTENSKNRKWAQALINGMDFNGMDKDAVKEQMKDYKIDVEYSDGLSMTYKDGKYAYKFSFNEDTGLVSSVQAELKLDKKYH